MLQINILYIMGQTDGSVFSESYFLVYSIVALAWIQLFIFQKLVIITWRAQNYVGRDYIAETDTVIYIENFGHSHSVFS